MNKRHLFGIFLLALLGTIGLSPASAGAEQIFQGISGLDVESGFFSVEVSGGPGEDVRLRVEIPDYLARRYEIRREVDQGRLKVWVERRAPYSHLSITGNPRLIFTVPASIDLDLSGSSGRIDVRGIKSRRLRARASSGGLRLREIEADLNAETSSGGLALEACHGRKVLRTASGSLMVRGARGEIEASSSSGGQTYIDVRGDLRAESSSGGIRLDGFEGALMLRASSGSLSGRDVLLTGDSRFQTSSGSISFAFRNRMEDLRFTLNSTSGSLSVGGSSRSGGSLAMGNGDILVIGASTSGSQRYTAP